MEDQQISLIKTPDKKHNKSPGILYIRLYEDKLE